MLTNYREGFLQILTLETNGPAIPGVIWKYDLFFFATISQLFSDKKKTKIFVQMLFSENINYINNLFANLLDKW